MISTLDFYHTKKIGEFKCKWNNIEKNLLNDDLSLKQLEKLHKELNDIIEKENDYCLKSMDLIIDYYKDSLQDELNTTGFTNLDKFLGRQTYKNKTGILEKYLNRVDTKYKNKEPNPDNNNIEENKKEIDNVKCNNEDCNNTPTIDPTTSSLICENCGYTQFIVMQPHTSKLLYKNHEFYHFASDTAIFSYRRYDHFVEWLNKIHYSPKCGIPKKVIEILRLKLKSSDDITIENIQSILKKTGNSMYISKSNVLKDILTWNSKEHTIPICIRNVMKNMFKQIQVLWRTLKPKSRTNFLSYAYVIKKLLQILHQNQYMHQYELLKCEEKLYKQDLIWSSICSRLNWKFYPSL